MSTASGPTPSGSTACSAMPGNGLGIAGIGISLARRRTAARGPKRLATSMSFVGDRGAICQSSCAQPRAAAAASTAETMTIPVSPAFASRATCRRRTTSATCLAGSDRVITGGPGWIEDEERKLVTTCTEKQHPNHTHKHGPNCGHTAILHDGHVDYLHDGHLHHMHEDHVDEHVIPIDAANPVNCTPQVHCSHTHG